MGEFLWLLGGYFLSSFVVSYAVFGVGWAGLVLVGNDTTGIFILVLVIVLWAEIYWAAWLVARKRALTNLRPKLIPFPFKLFLILPTNLIIPSLLFQQLTFPAHPIQPFLLFLLTLTSTDPPINLYKLLQPTFQILNIQLFLIILFWHHLLTRFWFLLYPLSHEEDLIEIGLECSIGLGYWYLEVYVLWR